MAVSLQNVAGALGAFIRSLGSSTVPAGGEGILGAHLEDKNGYPLAVSHGQAARASQHGVPIAGMNDGNLLVLRADRFGGLASALHVPEFVWMPEGTTINTRLLVVSTSGFAPTQTAATGLQLNPTSVTAANSYAVYTSRRQFDLSVKQPRLLRIRARPVTIGVANASFDCGFGAPATVAAPANGCIWRVDGSGVVPLLYVNGGGPLLMGSPVTGLVNTNYYFFDVIKDDDAYVCSVQDPSTGLVLSRQVLQIPGGQARISATTRLPAYVRTSTGVSVPGTAPNVFVDDVYVALLDVQRAEQSGHTFPSAYGLGSETNPTSFATSSNVSNSAVAPTVTLSNTTPGSSLLDGGVRFAAPAGAVTDYTLFGYTVPSPYRFRSKSVYLSAKNLGAAVATTPTQIDFFLVVDGTASLASGSTKRKYLGTQTFAVGAAIGAQAAEGPIAVDVSASDLITEPGATTHIAARISTGTATASQVIEVMVAHHGHHE